MTFLHIYLCAPCNTSCIFLNNKAKISNKILLHNYYLIQVDQVVLMLYFIEIICFTILLHAMGNQEYVYMEFVTRIGGLN